jgi:hypothetical protein
MLSPLLMTAFATVVTASPVENVQYRGGSYREPYRPPIIQPYQPPTTDIPPLIVVPPPPPPVVQQPRFVPVCVDRYGNRHFGTDCN